MWAEGASFREKMEAICKVINIDCKNINDDDLPEMIAEGIAKIQRDNPPGKRKPLSGKTT